MNYLDASGGKGTRVENETNLESREKELSRVADDCESSKRGLRSID